MNEKQNLSEIIFLIREHFGYKVDINSISKSERTIQFTLYDSFVFSIGLGRYEAFGASLILGENISTPKLFNNKIAENNDRDSIIRSLEKMDEYCRLRLPDKYLEKYEKSYFSESEYK